MKKLGLLALTFLLLSVSGCNPKEDKEILEPGLISSEKSLPLSFEQMASEHDQEKYVVERVKNKKDYRKMWNKFQMKEELVDIDTEAKDVLFIGLFESSSCSYDINDTFANSEKNELEVNLSSKSGNCTADASPRNFVLTLDKSVSNELSTVVLVDGVQRISLPINDK
ncbi:hypothetical protein FITA111629_00100 [Filibacter tadaridae]|uniref:Lipoprotein n=1 Tax=Filibacter tadaridae TaxID=2483811 RepID=A0A3P5XC09_9BACL|nr:hypothetical protein [Filibacter tadaridae]VDC28846.1 hypothetical protein FILTAD_01869 [Filibacter tadaridae]